MTETLYDVTTAAYLWLWDRVPVRVAHLAALMCAAVSASALWRDLGGWSALLVALVALYYALRWPSLDRLQRAGQVGRYNAGALMRRERNRWLLAVCVGLSAGFCLVAAAQGTFQVPPLFFTLLLLEGVMMRDREPPTRVRLALGGAT